MQISELQSQMFWIRSGAGAQESVWLISLQGDLAAGGTETTL